MIKKLLALFALVPALVLAQPSYPTRSLALTPYGKVASFVWPVSVESSYNTPINSSPMTIVDVPPNTTIKPNRASAAISVNWGPFTNQPQPLKSGDTVVVQHKSSAVPDAQIRTLVVFSDPVYGSRALAGWTVRTRNDARAPQFFQVGENRTIKTLNEIAPILVAGDVVELDPGIYPPVVLTRSGTVEKPITIRGNNSVFSGGVVTVELKGSNNIILDNIEITGGTTVGLRTSAHNIVLQNSRVYKLQRHGILGLDYGGGNFTIKNCEIYEVGNILPKESYQHAVYVATDKDAYPNSTLRLEHNYIHSYKGNGVKSRAARTELYYNWIDGQNNPLTLYNVELIGYQGYYFHTDRLDSDVVGNVFITNNMYSMRVGGDGSGASRGRVRLAHNSFIIGPLVNQYNSVIKIDQKFDSIYLVNNTFERINGNPLTLRLLRNNIILAENWTSGRIKIAGTTNLMPVNRNFGAVNELVNTVSAQTMPADITVQLDDYSISNPLTRLEFVANPSTRKILRTVIKLGALE